MAGDVGEVASLRQLHFSLFDTKGETSFHSQNLVYIEKKGEFGLKSADYCLKTALLLPVKQITVKQ